MQRSEQPARTANQELAQLIETAGMSHHALARRINLLAERSGIAFSSDEPAWISYYTPARMAADAVEIHRDLGLPAAALRWNNRAAPMPESAYTRSVGLRMTVLATAHLQNRDLDQALAHGQRAVTILSHVRSTRATDYLAGVVRAMAPWRRDPRVIDLSHLAHQAIALSTTATAR